MTVRVRAPAFTLATVLLLLGAASTALAEEAETFYLSGDGVPRATLSTTTPVHDDLPNYDPGRDIAPGLLVEISELGMQESDEARFQQWQTGLGGYKLSGVPVLVLWAAVEGFEPGKTGVYTAYLLDCDEWGFGCQAFAAKKLAFRAEPGETWVETVIVFDEVDHQIDEARTLGLRVVVSAESYEDLLFAYDRLDFRSRLMFTSEELVPPVEPSPEVLATPALENSPAMEDEPVAGAAIVKPATVLVRPLEFEASWVWIGLFGFSSMFVGMLALYLLKRLRHSLGGPEEVERGGRPTTTPS